MTNPMPTLTIAKKGETNGLPRNEEMPDQSRLMAPIPSPFSPEPICCAVTDLGNAQHINETEVNVWKK